MGSGHRSKFSRLFTSSDQVQARKFFWRGRSRHPSCHGIRGSLDVRRPRPPDSHCRMARRIAAGSFHRSSPVGTTSSPVDHIESGHRSHADTLCPSPDYMFHLPGNQEHGEEASTCSSKGREAFCTPGPGTTRATPWFSLTGQSHPPCRRSSAHAEHRNGANLPLTIHGIVNRHDRIPAIRMYRRPPASRFNDSLPSGHARHPSFKVIRAGTAPRAQQASTPTLLSSPALRWTLVILLSLSRRR